MTLPAPTPTLPRWYVRCADCLSVAAIDGVRPLGNAAKATCTCGGAIEIMGRVERSRLHVRTEQRVPCDARCTNARGPHCDCQCSGRNHGTHLLVTVDVTAPIPRVVALDPDQALTRATAYRDALAAAQDAVATGPAHARGRAAGEARSRGQWVGDADFRAWLSYGNARRSIVRAMGLRTHAGRIAALARIAAAASAVAPECAGHPAGPADPAGQTVYCDGTCRISVRS